MQLGLEKLWNHETHPNCRIYTDSQTAIKAIEHPQRQSGQSIIKDLLNCIDEILEEHTQAQIEIVWIPGHSDIQGNERVDTEAKKAATDSTVTQLPRRRPLKSARGRTIKALAKEQWRKIWNEGTTTAKKLRRITKTQRKGTKLARNYITR